MLPVINTVSLYCVAYLHRGIGSAWSMRGAGAPSEPSVAVSLNRYVPALETMAAKGIVLRRYRAASASRVKFVLDKLIPYLPFGL